MENVEFNEESIARSAPAAVRQPKGLIGFLIKKGWARDEKAAQYILGGVAVVAFLISLFFWSSILVTPSPEEVPVVGEPTFVQ